MKTPTRVCLFLPSDLFEQYPAIKRSIQYSPGYVWDQPEKLGGNRKSATFAAMETGYELLLPEGVLKYFEVVFAEKTSSTITIHLDELNIIPEEYKEDKLESKGFYPSVAIQDYPLRGKVVILQVRRRRWTNHSTGDIVCRNWDMVAKGTRLTQEFASFLKELHRYSSC
jgi:hypothetical protein